MKWKCNACLETENGYLPCIYENPMVKQEPTFCPLVKDECDWEPFDVAQQSLSGSDKSSPKCQSMIENGFHDTEDITITRCKICNLEF